MLGCEAGEIYFTSGGTEGNNMVIKGVVENKKQERMRIVTTAIEHPSGLDVFHFYESHHIDVVYLPVNGSGHISLNDLNAAVNGDTVLVSIMGVNNELGSVNDLRVMGEIIRKRIPAVSSMRICPGLYEVTD